MAVVVSHIADGFDALARQALRQQGLADVIEIRIDRIGHPGKDALRAFLGEAQKPVIVACPGPEDGGAFDGSVDERLDLLHDAAEAGASFVDVGWELSLELGEMPGKCHRIVSRHDFEGLPDDLEAFHEDVAAVLYEGDITKLVTTATSCEDGLRMLRYLRGTRGVVGFCMGDAGRFTRVLAPVFGSPFTYCAPAAMPGEPEPEATAPGQLRASDLVAIMPPGGANQETAIFGVVGNPVGSSWSPWVQGMALKHARLNALYLAFEPETLAGFLELADDENFRGFSITAPFKQEAHALAATRDAGSDGAGAVNTLIRDRTGWRGVNTDVSAVRDTLERAFHIHGVEPGRPVSPMVAHVLVLGTGGAARAAAWALRSIDGRVTVVGRDRAKAGRLAEEIGCEACDWDAIPTVEYDALVHCTPVGSPTLAGEQVVPEEWIRPGTLVLDAVYRPIRTPLLMAAKRRGCTVVPGGEWFVRQAVAQYRLFTNTEPDEELMRKAFEHALGAEG
ncbi:MAG: type I 3-dehydroquinate dehydratase [Planctomycetota bacterium]|nr:type I 3-dehydroquinate dehydratase [Planctomycetota bacterium]